MKRLISIFMALFFLITFSQNASATVTPSPSGIKIPRDMQTTRAIRWNLVEPSTITTAQSTQGTFSNGLGTINTTITVPMSYNPVASANMGSFTEALTIPVAVIERAERAGIRIFTYTRTFTGMSFPGNTGSVTVTLSTVSGSDLVISRMRLYFDNGRGEITVKRKEEGLKTYADIYYSGKGLFRGYWQVDNRVISYVNKHLVYGRKLSLETPNMPALPTFSEGTHTVQFIIQSPNLGIAMPKAIYYVRPLEATEIIPIAQKDPYDRAPLDFLPITFRWDEEDRLATYLVEFMEGQNEKPVFSAYSRVSEYTMPPYVLNYYFETNKRYFWKVKGFDSQDEIAGESEVREFRFKAE